MLRIGELSRRSGVSPELLRAWERRYGLLQPTRSAGGLRLYSRRRPGARAAMQQHLADGLGRGGGRRARATQRAASVSRTRFDPPATARQELAAALASFDEGRAHEVIDALLAARVDRRGCSRTSSCPYLHELGERWERGEMSVAQEHFASTLLRGRLLGLARGWGKGLGPSALLACAPGEQHDLGLIAFGLALRARGWRIVFLGADTPLESVADAARTCDPAFVVISAVDGTRLPSARGGARLPCARGATLPRWRRGGQGPGWRPTSSS